MNYRYKSLFAKSELKSGRVKKFNMFITTTTTTTTLAKVLPFMDVFFSVNRKLLEIRNDLLYAFDFECWRFSFLVYELSHWSV